MRHFHRRWGPPFTRALLIESGSRSVLESFIPWIYAQYGNAARIDVVTCYGGPPGGMKAGDNRVFNVVDYGGAEGRGQLLAELLQRDYTVAVMICSGEPIMTKWKWWLAWKLPLKFLVLNENADFFWIDRTQWRLLAHFVLFRAGLTGEGAAARLGELLMFPLTLAWLLMFAGWVHLKRAIRMSFAKP